MVLEIEIDKEKCRWMWTKLAGFADYFPALILGNLGIIYMIDPIFEGDNFGDICRIINIYVNGNLTKYHSNSCPKFFRNLSQNFRSHSKIPSYLSLKTIGILKLLKDVLMPLLTVK